MAVYFCCDLCGKTSWGATSCVPCSARAQRRKTDYSALIVLGGLALIWPLYAALSAWTGLPGVILRLSGAIALALLGSASLITWLKGARHQ